MSAWRVRVKDLQGQEYVLDVNGYNPGGTTLAQLKAKLQQKSGIHSAKQRLVFNREPLNNNGKTLLQYGIGNESCLQIVILSGWIIRVEDRHNPGRVLEVLIEGHDPQNKTVQHLKEEIIKIQGESVMRLHEIRLMKHSAELNDRNTLSQCGVIDNDTIQMRKKNFSPWNIFVKGLSGRTHTVVITQQNPEETTVAQLKELVKEKTGVIPEEQRLCFGSKPLENHHRFEDLNITNNATIFLVVRMKGGAHQGMVGLLRESTTKTIDNITGCPIFRACPKCGTLLEHTQGCRNFNCWSCKTHFCFICLTLGQNNTLPCRNNCHVAPRQTYIPGQ